MERVAANGLVYLREQDGIPERELKARLSAIFEKIRTVRRAYLILCANGGQCQVALGLRLDGQQDEVLRAIESAFKSIFHGSQHLDIVLLDEPEEVRLHPVCKPFFSA